MQFQLYSWHACCIAHLSVLEDQGKIVDSMKKIDSDSLLNH